VVGLVEEIFSSVDVWRSERSDPSMKAKYVNNMTHALSLQTKKKLWFQNQIWGL